MARRNVCPLDVKIGAGGTNQKEQGDELSSVGDIAAKINFRERAVIAASRFALAARLGLASKTQQKFTVCGLFFWRRFSGLNATGKTYYRGRLNHKPILFAILQGAGWHLYSTIHGIALELDLPYHSARIVKSRAFLSTNQMDLQCLK